MHILALVLTMGWSAAYDLPPVKVRAKRPSQAPIEAYLSAPVSSSSVNTLDILKIPTARIASRGENDWELPQVRGQDSTQSRWYLESIPLTSGAFGTSQAHLVPMESLQSLDVWAGLIPTFIAGDGLGGAFRLRLRSLPDPGVLVNSRLGSFGSKRLGVRAGLKGGTVTGVVHEGQEDFWYLDANATPFNTNDDLWRRRAHSAFRRVTLLPHGRCNPWDERMSCIGMYSRGDSQIPGPISAPDGGQLVDEYGLAALQMQFTHGPVELYPVFFGSVDSQAYRAGQSFSAQTALSATRLQRAGAGVELSFPGWIVSVRPQWERLRMESSREVATGSKWWVPIGLSMNWELANHWVVRPGLVFHRVEYPENVVSHNLISPRLSLEKNGPGGAFVASLGNYFRHPTITEVYGAVRVFQGNPGLLPERSLKLDLAYSLELLKGLSVTASHFHGWSRDLVVYFENAQGLMVASNVGHSWIWGTSLGAQGRWRVFGARLSLADLNTKNLSRVPSQQGKNLPGRPDHELRAELDWSWGSWRMAVSDGLNGPMFLDSANRRRMMATHSLDLALQYRSNTLGDFDLNLKNVLDSISAEHQIGSYRFNDPVTGIEGYPAAGRRVYFSWSLSL